MPFRTDRMQEIERKLEELTKENASLRRRISLSMREDHICPRCEHTKVVHASTILDRADGGARTELSVIQPSAWKRKTEGKFEVYICNACGFVEWYVKDPDQLGDHDKSRELLRFLQP